MNTPTPGLNPTTPGLRTVRYDARSAAKVSLIVQPGDTLIVSDDVADQLAASSAQFKTDAPVERPVQADESIAEVTEEATVSDTPAAKRAPRKRAAKPKG